MNPREFDNVFSTRLRRQGLALIGPHVVRFPVGTLLSMQGTGIRYGIVTATDNSTGVIAYTELFWAEYWCGTLKGALTAARGSLGRWRRWF